jgi:hypothetical protein
MNWEPINGAESLDYDEKMFWWDSTTVPDGDGYRFRVVSNSETIKSDESDNSYTVHNLGKPWGPQPEDGATQVPINTNLDWNDASFAISYDIYIWESGKTKPATPTASGLLQSFYNPPSFKFSTKYCWQVISKSQTSKTDGEEWEFTTSGYSSGIMISQLNGNDEESDD